MSLEVVATPEGSIAVVTDEVLLDFQGKVVIHLDWWKYMLSTTETTFVKPELNVTDRSLWRTALNHSLPPLSLWLCWIFCASSWVAYSGLPACPFHPSVLMCDNLRLFGLATEESKRSVFSGTVYHSDSYLRGHAKTDWDNLKMSSCLLTTTS